MFTRIVVVAAMETELAFIRKAMSHCGRPEDRVTEGTIGSRSIMLLRTGVGPRKTARRLAGITRPHDPHCVLSIGCAGALNSALEVGDVVISETVIDVTAGGRTYSPSPELVETAKDCCERLKLRFHSGTTVSTSDVVATPEDKESLATKYNALSVDMESAQVAAWADAAGIPMLSVRAISDASADRIPPEINAVFGPGGKPRLLKALTLLVWRPATFLELVRLKRKFDRSLATLEKVGMMLLQKI